MRNKEVSENTFSWMLQGICALHRKLLLSEIFQQQLAVPLAPESFPRAAKAYGFGISLLKTKPATLHIEKFPLIVWALPNPTTLTGISKFALVCTPPMLTRSYSRDRL
jgi:ATP-binding cassette, subfamily B, bacterial HlyB/CyaB